MTSDDNVFEIALANELQEIVSAAAKIDAFCEEKDLSPEIAYAVNLSVDEILTNTISYGYDDDEPHRIEIIVRREADSLVVVIVDDSAAFDLSSTPEVDLGASLDDRALGGLGLFLVHQMMDAVEYQRMDGCNVVTLTKNTTDGSSETSA
jgi:anti-sigma regulatory factor (Ser/Thr protein kinase)